MDVWLVVGSALYWASVGFRYLGPVSGYPPALGLWTPVAKYTFLVAVIACAYGVMRMLGVRRGRKVLASAVLVVSVVLGVVAVAGGWSEHRLLCMALEFFVIGSFMILWGLAFASFDRQRAAQNVIATVLLTVLIMVVGLAVSPAVPLAWFAYGFFAAAAVVMLVGRIPCASHGRETIRGQRGHKVVSAGQRLAFGLALGACSEVARWLGPGEASSVLVVLSVVILAASFVLAARSPGGLYTALPALLLVAVGALYLPFFEGGLSSAVWASAGIVWIAWSSFSGVQLSDLKERYGMNELDVCLADKLLLAVGFVLGGGVWAVGATLRGNMPLRRTEELLVFVAIAVLVLGSAYAMARLVGERREDAVRDELARTRENRLRDVYDQLAREAALSKREREVMEMLAKGYTSVYICEEMGVSAGTAKAHTAHIYQKLGIHRKDELLELIEGRLSEA